MEQGIRGFKTTGGPSHMTSDHDAMNVYFKSAPAMARTVTDFKQTYQSRRRMRETFTTSSLVAVTEYSALMSG